MLTHRPRAKTFAPLEKFSSRQNNRSTREISYLKQHHVRIASGRSTDSSGNKRTVQSEPTSRGSAAISVSWPAQIGIRKAQRLQPFPISTYHTHFNSYPELSKYLVHRSGGKSEKKHTPNNKKWRRNLRRRCRPPKIKLK